ncbi:MAG TPA: hypothetical protein VI685_27920, partial [Candidatus Angelobacter sp.]
LRISYGLLRPTLSAIDASDRKWKRGKVNAEDWCNHNIFSAQSAVRIPAEIAAFCPAPLRYPYFPQHFPQNCRTISLPNPHSSLKMK